MMSKQNELLESHEKFRYTTEPIEYPILYKMYIKARDSFWRDEELDNDLAKDAVGWQKLSDNEQRFIKHIVSFFAISDGVVVDVLSNVINNRIQLREAKLWYNFQSMIEDIHSIAYSKLVNIYITDARERQHVFTNIANMPNIKRKISWLYKWVGRENPFRDLDNRSRSALNQIANICSSHINTMLQFINWDTELADENAPIPRAEEVIEQIREEQVSIAQIILANAIVEGVFFSGSFCAIYWVNQYYVGLLPGLAKANEWISRDECMHTDFAVILYTRYIQNKLSQELVHRMMREAVEIESEFIADALPNDLKGMNANLMSQYIKFTADMLLDDLGYNKIWNCNNPFPWMKKQAISARIGDFFDTNLTEYGGHVNNGLSFGEDF